MKLLAIDAGNSRIKWGVHDGAAWSERGVLATADAAALTAALASLTALERIVIANVAGEAAQREIAESVRPFSVDAEWVLGRDEQCGVRSSYADASRLGADRWAALIAARHLHDGPCVVVNAGTTATVDALSADGIFLGGFIVPGLALMRHALANRTVAAAAKRGDHLFSGQHRRRHRERRRERNRRRDRAHGSPHRRHLVRRSDDRPLGRRRSPHRAAAERPPGSRG